MGWLDTMSFSLNNKNTLAPLYRRFVLAFVLLGLFLLAVSAIRSQLTQQRAAEQEQTALTERSQQRLERLLNDWESDAKRTISTLEFLRLDQLNTTQKQAKITAYFASQGERFNFDAVVITDAAHAPIHTSGCNNLSFAMTISQETLVEVLCEGQYSSALFHIIELPIWLGEQGEGYAHFAKQISPAVLAAINPTQGLTLLSYNDKPIASSQGNSRLDEWKRQLNQQTFNDAPAMSLTLSWPNDPHATLTILKPLPKADPWWWMILPPVVAVLFALAACRA
jgi:hypothetical protein